MKDWYNKYKNYVVIGLLVLLGFKSCQSCSKSRLVEYNEAKYGVLVDSLVNLSNEKDKLVDSLKNDIRLYTNELQSLNKIIDQYKEVNQTLKDDNKHYRNTNRVLVNTNNQIINKE
jgi:uncharacterized membrane protein YgaE (UPF0421/DUF939 family)